MKREDGPSVRLLLEKATHLVRKNFREAEEPEVLAPISPCQLILDPMLPEFGGFFQVHLHKRKPQELGAAMLSLGHLRAVVQG